MWTKYKFAQSGRGCVDGDTVSRSMVQQVLQGCKLLRGLSQQRSEPTADETGNSDVAAETAVTAVQVVYDRALRRWCRQRSSPYDKKRSTTDVQFGPDKMPGLGLRFGWRGNS